MSRSNPKERSNPPPEKPTPPDAETPTAETSAALPALRAPLDSIATAMQAQVELLRRLNERQRSLEDVVRDEKRHELVVNSARALNDAFRGMRESQEALAERLRDGGGGASKGFRILSAVGVVAAVAALFGLWFAFRKGAEELGSVAKTIEAPRADAEARAAIDDLAARVRGVEASEREAFRGELDRLRAATDAAAAERASLQKERDLAREELGLLRNKAAEFEKQAIDLRARFEASEKEVARLTTQNVADQRLISQLNGALETLRNRAAAAAKAATSGAPEGVGGETSPPAIDAATPRVEDLVEAAKPTDAPKEEGPTSAKADDPSRDLPFSPGQRDDLNALLARHRGSSRYSVVSASKIVDKKLQNVVMEVRAADGSLDKTIEAESMAVKISPRGELLDLDFESGAVVFHGSVSGRDARSPFFNGRYQIVLLGAPAKDWLSSGLSFVSMR
jgi:HAMP domain-containing protein